MRVTIRAIDRAPSPNAKRLLITILPAILGTLVVLVLAIIGIGIIKRRRKVNRQFNEAQLRDPSLTWNEYERRGNLTRSRLMVEEELLRSTLIRKTQQSRESAYREAAVAGLTRPSRSRSKTWHGRTKTQDADPEDGRHFQRETGGDWGSARANVEQTWQLLHGKKYPSLEGDKPLGNEPTKVQLSDHRPCGYRFHSETTLPFRGTL